MKRLGFAAALTLIAGRRWPTPDMAMRTAFCMDSGIPYSDRTTCWRCWRSAVVRLRAPRPFWAGAAAFMGAMVAGAGVAWAGIAYPMVETVIMGVSRGFRSPDARVAGQAIALDHGGIAGCHRVLCLGPRPRPCDRSIGRRTALPCWLPDRDRSPAPFGYRRRPVRRRAATHAAGAGGGHRALGHRHDGGLGHGKPVIPRRGA